MSAGARYMSNLNKVAVWSGPRRMLVPMEAADEILADLQVIYHQRCVNESDIERRDEAEASDALQ